MHRLVPREQNISIIIAIISQSASLRADSVGGGAPTGESMRGLRPGLPREGRAEDGGVPLHRVWLSPAKQWPQTTCVPRRWTQILFISLLAQQGSTSPSSLPEQPEQGDTNVSPPRPTTPGLPGSEDWPYNSQGGHGALVPFQTAVREPKKSGRRQRGFARRKPKLPELQRAGDQLILPPLPAPGK